MSLFDVADEADDLGRACLERVTRPIVLTEADQEIVRALLRPVRVYPCHRCSHNVSIRSTDDPRHPALAFCDPCNRPTDQCTCERIPYNASV